MDNTALPNITNTRSGKQIHITLATPETTGERYALCGAWAMWVYAPGERGYRKPTCGKCIGLAGLLVSASTVRITALRASA